MDKILDNLLRKHCSCSGVKNRILLETVTICPDCQSLFSTLIYEIPPERLREVLERLAALMDDLGIRCQGATTPVTFAKASAPRRALSGAVMLSQKE